MNFRFFLKKEFLSKFTLSSLFLLLFSSNTANAFPIYAQQAYTSPREANGRIVCANCHLAQKPVEIEAPSSVLPDKVFEAEVKIPYDLQSKQVLANGQKGGLNVGAIVILPEGFKLAPTSRLTDEVKTKNKGVYISPYSADKENILVVGPIAGDKHQEIIFPVLAPDPAKNSSVNYFKYPIYVGANRGRGQVNPNGEKTNVNVYVAETSGQIKEIVEMEKGNLQVSILDSESEVKKQTIPAGPKLVVKAGQIISKDQPLTEDPNVGGFGQTETEIVLQNVNRVAGYVAVSFALLLAQIAFVVKKKQFEKVQAAEMNF